MRRNLHDLYAVAVKILDLIVSHACILYLALYQHCLLFLPKGGSIICTVSGIRNYLDDLWYRFNALSHPRAVEHSSSNAS